MILLHEGSHLCGWSYYVKAYFKYYKSIYLVLEQMKCTRCLRNAQTIMCSTCYSENCKHNEQGRTAIIKKYEEVVNTFQFILAQNLHYGNAFTIINRKAATMHSNKSIAELLQSKHDLFERRKRQNQLLRQKINERKAYIQKLQAQTKNLQTKIKTKQNEKKIVISRSQHICYRIKQKLQAKFKSLMRFLKDNQFKSSKQQWNKFVNMEQQCLSLYVTLVQNQSQISRIHEQIIKQMIVLTIISNLLEICLPYPVELKNLSNSNGMDVLFLHRKEGKILNKQLLREFQANANYLFSRFNVQMEYPHLDFNALSTTLSVFAQRRLKIIDETSNFDYTQPIYISSLDMMETILSKPIIFSQSIGVAIESVMFELSAEGVLNHHKIKDITKFSLEEETTEEIEYTQVIQFDGFRSIGSSDEEMEVLQ